MEPMAPPAQKRRPMAEINVVPYIDVMLVLVDYLYGDSSDAGAKCAG